MTQTALARQDSLAITRQVFGDERIAVLKDQIAPGASDTELELFATVAKRTGLDPFAKQIWSMSRRRKVNDRWETYQVIHIGVQGLRLVAARTREYQGQIGPFWCGEDGEWRDVWLAKEAPRAARVGVRRKGFAEPIWSVAVWDRSVQLTNDGKPMARWASNGAEMLALAAERDALRRAFPIETADLEPVIDAESEREAMQTSARRYDEIFGDEEGGTAFDLERDPRRQRLTQLIAEARKRGIAGEPGPMPPDADPVDAAISWWEQRLENYDLDQHAARQSGQLL